MARKKNRSCIETNPVSEVLKEPEVVSAEWPTAVYARLSIENSGKDDKGESIEGQVEICRDYIDEHPYLQYVDTYVDNGWTGTNMDRPQFQRLLNDIYSGRIKALVIKDFSRFSRDYIEAGNLLENVFPAFGVRFISVADRYDSLETDGSADSLLIPLKNLINSFYSRDISRKVSSAVHTRQMAGEYISNMVPYGYIKSATREYRFEPDPETAAIVKRIFQMRIDGVPTTRIARILQDEGIPSPGRLRFIRGQTTDKRYETAAWSHSYVKAILQNPTYLGHQIFGKCEKALYTGMTTRRYEKDESKWRILRNVHEPLVTQEAFDQVQTLCREKREETETKMRETAEYRTQNVPFFADRLYCGDCGRVMIYHRDRERLAQLTGCYGCGNDRHRLSCSSHNISQDRLKRMVWQAIKAQLDISFDYDAIAQKLQSDSTTSLMDGYRRQIQKLGIQVENCRSKRERLYEDFADGILTPEEYMMLKKRYDADYQKFSLELTENQRKLARLKNFAAGENGWLKAIRQFSDAVELSREMLDALVDKVLVYEDADGSRRVEVQFRYAADRQLLESAIEELGGETK